MGKTDLENFPTSRSALRMLDDVSTGFYENSYVGKWLYQVMGLEYDDAFRLAEALPEQFFPETATWGLKYHEMKWQLPVREDLSYEERRRLVYRKMAYRAPMTPYRMEEYLRVATGLNVQISDCHDSGPSGFQPDHPNIFLADFIGGSTSDVIRALQILNRIKQSHTVCRMRHSIKGKTAGIWITACLSTGAALRIKAKLTDSVAAADRLPVLSAHRIGGMLKVKTGLTENLSGHSAGRITAPAAHMITGNVRIKTAVTESVRADGARMARAGVMCAENIRVKTKTAGELGSGMKVAGQVHARIADRIYVKH